MALQVQYKKIQSDVLDSAHRVWLAGLGAVSVVEEQTGKMFDDLVDRGRKLEKQGRKQIDQLVQRGQRVEKEGKKQADKVRSEAGNRLDEWQGELDQRLGKVVQRFGIPNREQIATLTRRVEELTRKVEAIQGAERPRRVYHLLPNEEGWMVKAEGAELSLSTHGTKDEALTAARELAQMNEPSRLVVHRLDGTVQTSYTYGEEAEGL